MTLSEQLAELARAPITAAEADHLRMLTLTNLSAAAGELGNVTRLLPHLPAGRTAGDEAMRAGVRLHARTQDDFFPLGRSHVGAVTIAAALALADRAEDRFLECVAAGYSVLCTTSAVYAATAQRRGLRPTGVFGPLAAAATAAECLRLGRDGMAGAIGLAAAMAGGTNQAWLSGSDEWVLQAGVAARVGVEAASLIEGGARSAPEALEGAKGWAGAMFDDGEARRLADAFGEPASGVHDVAAKLYPVSGIAQVATHLACQAHERFRGAEPREVTVALSPEEAAYPGSTGPPPHSRSAALMSVAYCVACGLRYGEVRLEHLEPVDELVGLAARVRVVVDPDLADTHARLSVRSEDGEVAIEGRGADILFPRWSETSAASEELAARSEASPAMTARLAAELAIERPHAGQLLLEGVLVA